MATVAKPFNTTIQRFKLGAEISETDDLSPHTIESLKAGGFIKDEALPVSAAQPTFGKRPIEPTPPAPQE